MSNSSAKTDDLNGLRAFLQRAETRLSTMHRVAGVFLNGAGLLVLFPVFFKDAYLGIVDALWPPSTADGLTVLLPADQRAKLFLSVAFGAALLVAVGIPIYALYLLVEDIVHFYFQGHSPGLGDAYYPRFTLSALAYPSDEVDAQKLKAAAIKHEYEDDWVHFIVPHMQKKRQGIGLSNEFVWENYNTIISAARQRDTADAAWQKSLPIAPPNKSSVTDKQAFNVVLGQAGMVDRTMEEELAKVEVSLARHNWYLRRLVLRYTKALLLLVWTTLAAFSTLSLLKHSGPSRYEAALLAFAIWSVVTVFVVRIPKSWIYGLSDRRKLQALANQDNQLRLFENVVTISCGASVALSAVAGASWWLFG